MIRNYTERWREHDRERAELAKWAREQAREHGTATYIAPQQPTEAGRRWLRLR